MKEKEEVEVAEEVDELKPALAEQQEFCDLQKRRRTPSQSDKVVITYWCDSIRGILAREWKMDQISNRIFSKHNP